MESKNSIFEELMQVDVSQHLEKKKVGTKELSYLSWPYAWAEIKKRYPDATYKIWRDEKGLPYAFDPNTGYMVFVSLFAGGQEFPCFLPVMDENCNPMKDKKYEFSVNSENKIYTFTVQPATMFDINRTIMRCLVKACAFAGLGLNVFAGEDINSFASGLNGTSEDGKKTTKKESNKVNAKKDNDEDDEDDGELKLSKHHEATLDKILSVGLSLGRVMKYFPDKSYEQLSESDLTEIDKMCVKYAENKRKVEE